MRNKINQYTCDTCGNTITTIDRDEGTTSFYLSCRAKVGCAGHMTSAMYQCDQSLTPDYEWYKPTGTVKKIYREHVRMGGLLIRRVGGQ